MSRPTDVLSLLSCRCCSVRNPSKSILKLLMAGFLLAQLGACASNVARSIDPNRSGAYFKDKKEPAGNLTANLTPEARKLAAENLAFDHKKMLETVRRALELNGILTKGPEDSRPSIEIQITSVYARSNFSAVMFGFLAGDDHVKGNVIVRKPDGGIVQNFGVSASYALGGLAGGQDTTRMGWLYETFAKHVVQELTGKSEDQLESAGQATAEGSEKLKKQQNQGQPANSGPIQDSEPDDFPDVGQSHGHFAGEPIGKAK